MRRFQDRVAVVTGAAAGIGRGLSESLARRGCDLALVDRNEEGLRETAALVHETGRKASLHATDVAEREQMEALPDDVLRAHGGVHLLVNSAGVSVAGPFEQTSLEDFSWIVGINFWGPVYGCKFFLPHLRLQEEAHIVNLISTFGLISFPTKSAYCATKFALRGFSDALRAELHGSPVGLTSVYPGPVNTDLMRGGRAWDTSKRDLEASFWANRSIPMEIITARILRGIERNAARVLIGRETVATDLMKRLCPVWTDTLVARLRKRIPFL